jgi:hypothetical protein
MKDEFQYQAFVDCVTVSKLYKYLKIYMFRQIMRIYCDTI